MGGSLQLWGLLSVPACFTYLDKVPLGSTHRLHRRAVAAVQGSLLSVPICSLRSQLMTCIPLSLLSFVVPLDQLLPDSVAPPPFDGAGLSFLPHGVPSEL